MCGLAGIVDFARPAAAHAERLAAMRVRLRHRGPDGEGEHAAGPVSLAHTRLSILDHEGGAQPMASPDGRYVIVYNGELANADALRRDLDWSFRTRSDTEVVLAAYARWGAACAARLSGMFAFFVWDAALERGLGARDRLGVKPLFVAHDGSAFVFASEAHAIARTSRQRPRLDVAGAVEALVAPCFSGVARSLFEGVAPLPAGHVVVVDASGERVEEYWDWPCAADHERDHDERRVVAELREAVPRAIERSLAADVPLGLFSSGGLDSTLIAATMAARSKEPVPAYTVTFDDQASFDYARSGITSSDDTPYARDVARELALDPRLVHVRRTRDRRGSEADRDHQRRAPRVGTGDRAASSRARRGGLAEGGRRRRRRGRDALRLPLPPRSRRATRPGGRPPPTRERAPAPRGLHRPARRGGDVPRGLGGREGSELRRRPLATRRSR